MESLPPGATLRFDLPCEVLGLTVPHTAINLRFVRTTPRAGKEAGWTAIVVVAAGKAKDAVAWISGQAAGRAMLPPGLAPRTIRYEVTSLPKAWEDWLTAAHIVQVDVASHGLATLFVQGTAEQLARLAAHLSLRPGATRQRISATKPVEAVAITPRQLEALCNAVTMGYYDVPHRVDLRELGHAMDLSVSAVSQLLRRAQGQIICAFIDANTLSRVKAMAGNGDDLPSDLPAKEA